MNLPAIVGRRYWRTTLLVIAAMAVMIRLGFWQIDRLHQRQARNAEISRLLALPPLALGREPLPEDLSIARYRHGTATGTFDLSRQVALKFQNFDATAGIHLIAPLVLGGGREAVLVDRGWVPDELSAPANWAQFDEQGAVTVAGYLRPSEALPGREPAAGPQSGQMGWYRVDIGAIQAQMPYRLLPVYLLQSPRPEGNLRLPYRTEPEFDLSDGAHLGYALQWWLFAGLAAVVYVSYVSRATRRAAGRASSRVSRETNAEA